MKSGMLLLLTALCVTGLLGGLIPHLAAGVVWVSPLSASCYEHRVQPDTGSETQTLIPACGLLCCIAPSVSPSYFVHSPVRLMDAQASLRCPPMYLLPESPPPECPLSLQDAVSVQERQSDSDTPRI